MQVHNINMENPEQQQAKQPEQPLEEIKRTLKYFLWVFICYMLAKFVSTVAEKAAK